MSAAFQFCCLNPPKHFRGIQWVCQSHLLQSWLNICRCVQAEIYMNMFYMCYASTLKFVKMHFTEQVRLCVCVFAREDWEFCFFLAFVDITAFYKCWDLSRQSTKLKMLNHVPHVKARSFFKVTNLNAPFICSRCYFKAVSTACSSTVSYTGPKALSGNTTAPAVARLLLSLEQAALQLTEHLSENKWLFSLYSLPSKQDMNLPLKCILCCGRIQVFCSLVWFFCVPPPLINGLKI